LDKSLVDAHTTKGLFVLIRFLTSTCVTEYQLLKNLATGDKKVFNNLVRLYYTSLCRYAIKYVRSEEQAEEIVQDVFLSLWERRGVLMITTSLEAYLHTAVKYRSLNHLKKKLATQELISDYEAYAHPSTNNTEDQIAGNELAHLVTQAIRALPEKCRIIFDLSRNGGLTYREIATELNISPKTVETQISIALRRIKEFLGKHWDTLIPLVLVGTVF
jgi:RNA polymerase sigma-70 factor (ECF subfamily)